MGWEGKDAVRWVVGGLNGKNTQQAGYESQEVRAVETPQEAHAAWPTVGIQKKIRLKFLSETA